MSVDWRETQRHMFGGAELEQDARIKAFFKDSNHENTLLHGDTKYFTDFFPNKVKPYHNALMIFNNEIECGELIDTLLRLKNNINNARKICVAINKFLVYSEHNKQNISEDYDIALIKLITSQFDTFKIYSLIHDKNLKGDKFNFASPYTQIYLKNGNN